MRQLRALFAALVLTLAVLAAHAAGDNYTVIISLDGFRWDYAEGFNTPFFDRLADTGVKATMMPSFPSKTFPNHYTLATGLYPDHHGLIGNSFKNRETGNFYSINSKNPERNNAKHYGGEPIWLTAQRQGLKTATVYWVGSDVAVQGKYPTYWRDYAKWPLLTYDERVKEVIDHLKRPANERPRLIMCYFSEPDHSGHGYGPIERRHTRAQIEMLDSLLYNLWTRIKLVPEVGDRVNLIVTGDHGMTWLDPNRRVSVKQYLKKREWGLEIAGDSPAFIYCKSPEIVDSVMAALDGVDHIRAWRKGELPEYLHFGTHPNVGDVVVLPDVGWLFSDRDVKPHTGGHGFDHTTSDMLVGFRAIGPDFKQGHTHPGYFRNVDIYPLLCHLLGIEPAPNDGDLSEIIDMLKTR